MDQDFIQTTRTELFKGKLGLFAAYGNALMGLALPRPIATAGQPIDGQEPDVVYYQPLQPRTIVRVTKEGKPREVVNYGEFGFAQIFTMTPRFFVPGFVERDWAERVAPTEKYPWDGVAKVQVHPEQKASTETGVY